MKKPFFNEYERKLLIQNNSQYANRMQMLIAKHRFGKSWTYTIKRLKRMFTKKASQK